jgi:hypothetical protein
VKKFMVKVIPFIQQKPLSPGLELNETNFVAAKNMM